MRFRPARAETTVSINLRSAVEPSGARNSSSAEARTVPLILGLNASAAARSDSWSRSHLPLWRHHLHGPMRQHVRKQAVRSSVDDRNGLDFNKPLGNASASTSTKVLTGGSMVQLPYTWPAILAPSGSQRVERRCDGIPLPWPGRQLPARRAEGEP